VTGLGAWAIDNDLQVCFKQNNICIATYLRLRKDVNEREYERIIDRLANYRNAKG
jgi:hypothetical protein